MLFSSQMQNPGHPKVKSQLKSQVTSNCDSGSQEIRVVNNMQWLTADAIVKKLSKDEMKGLLAITAKMKRVEMDQAALQAEKEDLFARLQSVESVRDFLLEKVKETETALSASAEEVAQAAAQSASDHEVIGFLDSRAKELEKMKQDQEDSNRHLRTEIRVFQEQLQVRNTFYSPDRKNNPSTHVCLYICGLRLSKMSSFWFVRTSRKRKYNSDHRRSCS